MKLSILEALNVEEKEQSPVLLLIIQSLFLGIFYGAYDISAHTLFLTQYGETLIPNAYLLSGLVGIVLTSVYSFLQNKISFKKLIVFTFLMISIITLIMRLAFYSSGPGDQWLTFVIFLFLGPLNIVTLVAFWGMVGRMFTLRQGKRLFGIIGAGQIFGIIISSYAIPILPKWIKTQDLLLFSSISMVIAMFIQMFFLNRLETDEDEAVEEDDTVHEKKGANLPFKKFFQNKYILMMSLFVLFSMIVTFFVSYSFLAVANDKYPNENSIKDFLGVFTGTLMIFGLLVKTLVYSKLMKTYGIRVALLILPVLLLLFTILAMFSGTFLAFNSNGEALLSSSKVPQKFIFFFMLISLSRLFSLSLRDSIEIPAFKTLYQSLDFKIRYDVQAKIDGTVNEFSALFSGLLLIISVKIFGEDVIYFSYTTILLLLIWAVVAFLLFKLYKSSLQESIGKNKQEKSLHLIKNDRFIGDSLVNSVYEDVDKNICNIQLYRYLSPIHFEQNIPELFEEESTEVKKYILYYLLKNKLYKYKQLFDEKLAQDNDSTLNQIFSVIQDDFSDIFDGENKEIHDLIKSKYISHRIYAAQLIGLSKDEIMTPYLMLLLRDYSPLVVYSAIHSSSIIKKGELCPFLLNYLNNVEHFSAIYETIIKYGHLAFDSLNQFFNKTNISKTELRRIIRILSKIDHPDVPGRLMLHINFHDRYIVIEILKSLKAINYKAKSKDVYNLNQFLKQSINITAWNLNIRLQINNEIHSKNFIKAINEELHDNYELIFLILSILYDPQLIVSVRKYLDEGTAESISYAIELLDIFIEEELKSFLFPLIEDLSDTERIKRLQDFFPLQEKTPYDVLLDVLNRDYNFIHSWTKTCALMNILQLEETEINYDIISHLYNPDELIHETTMHLIDAIQPQFLNDYFDRLPQDKARKIQRIYEYKKEIPEDKLLNKVLFLQSLDKFSHFSAQSLTELAKIMKFKQCPENQRIDIGDDFYNDYTIILLEGLVVSTSQKKVINQYQPHQILSKITTIENFENKKYITKKASKIFVIETSKFLEWIFDNIEQFNTNTQIINLFLN